MVQEEGLRSRFNPLNQADGSNSLKWWTLSQRIGTLAEIPFEVALLITAEPPKYQQIAEKALHLNQLGLTNEAIARQLGVDGKTVAKALRWVIRMLGYLDAESNFL